jgi:cytochrome c peroxidase
VEKPIRGRPRLVRYASVCIAVLTLTLGMSAVGANLTNIDGREPLASLKPVTGLNAESVALGKRLFSDVILSANQDQSCMTCHDLSAGGTSNSSRSAGQHGRTHGFNAPTVFNVGSNYRLGWRGEFTSLESQNEKILLDEDLMGAAWPTIIDRLTQNETYATLFERVFKRQPDKRNILDALSSFQRSLTTPNSAFDRYINGDSTALTRYERGGYQAFKDYGCASCHQGSNVGGNMFQRFGIFANPPSGETAGDGDLGRYTLTGNPSDRGVFRVPSLRNVEVTAPYFHDGRVATLSEAVEIMGTSQLGRNLTTDEINALVAFLKTLTGEYNGRKLQAAPAKDD